MSNRSAIRSEVDLFHVLNQAVSNSPFERKEEEYEIFEVQPARRLCKLDSWDFGRFMEGEEELARLAYRICSVHALERGVNAICRNGWIASPEWVVRHTLDRVVGFTGICIRDLSKLTVRFGGFVVARDQGLPFRYRSIRARTSVSFSRISIESGTC